MLKIKDLHVSYGGIKALRGINIEVPDGKIVTLIGANGAGKSTLLRTISGLVKAESGSILLDDEELIGKQINKICESGIALSPEGRRVFADLTVMENLRIGAYLRNDKKEIEKDLEWVFNLFPRLKERSWQYAGTLSGGEQQMLAVGRALMSRPKILMLDEPSLGLAPLIVQQIFNIIREINNAGVTVLLIEQNANMALKTADIAYVIETGEIVLSGSGTQVPIYEQVENQIRQSVLSGELSANEMLPSIRRMAKELGIGIITVKRAYDDLCQEGLLVSIQGRGVFVAEINAKQEKAARLEQLTQKLQEIKTFCAVLLQRLSSLNDAFIFMLQKNVM